MIQTFIKIEEIMINTMYITINRNSYLRVNYLGYILRLSVKYSLNENILCRHEE